jgi:hypothetical protein
MYVCRKFKAWLTNQCSAGNFARRMECYRCHVPKPCMSTPAIVLSLTETDHAGEPTAIVAPANTGDSDVSPESTPSQFLLFRGLEASVTEELFAKGVAKLYKLPEEPGVGLKKAKVTSTTASSNFGATEGSIRRVFVVRRRSSDDSCRYGFAEFRAAEVRSTQLRGDDIGRLKHGSCYFRHYFEFSCSFTIVPIFDSEPCLPFSGCAGCHVQV